MLILHIGTEKTGTKTLQNWFSINREDLRGQGVYYPKIFGKKSHWHLSVYAQDSDKPDDGFYNRKLFSPEDHNEFCRKLRGEFEKEFLENRAARAWVISSEHLHSRLTNVEMVNRVKNMLEPKFSKITVIIHLRPQADLAVSLTTTAGRFGTKVDERWFGKVEANNTYYDFNSLVERWETVFGKDNIVVVPFLRFPSMTSQLIRLLEIDCASLTDIERLNQSLDWRTINLLNNLSIPMFDEDKLINNNREVFVEDLPNVERIQIGLELAQDIQSRFDASNDILIERRPELIAGDLTPDWTKYDAQPNLSLIETECLFKDQLNYLVSRFNWELKLERCRTMLAECERALAQKSDAKAREFLGRAIQIRDMIPEAEATSPKLSIITARVDRLGRKIAT